MITAGHCGDNVTWKHNGVTVGTEVKNSLWDSEFYDYLWLRWAVNSDSERIDVVDTKEDWANNWVFRNNSQKDYALIGTQGAGGIDVGDTVCMTGMISGTKCGQVQNADATSCCVHPPESRYDAYLYHMISATYTSNPGDSGGPVYGLGLNGLKWVGVNHGTGNGTGLASRQANVVTDLNLDAWCTVSDC